MKFMEAKTGPDLDPVFWLRLMASPVPGDCG